MCSVSAFCAIHVSYFLLGMPLEKKIFLFVRNTLPNKCPLKLLFLYAPMRNICKYCDRAALFEQICSAHTSEQGLEGW